MNRKSKKPRRTLFKHGGCEYCTKICLYNAENVVVEYRANESKKIKFPCNSSLKKGNYVKKM